MPRGEKILRPVHPNVGIGVEYRRRLDALVEEMHRSYAWWLRARYREHTPKMAQDASPAVELQRELRWLAAKWQAKFDEGAGKLARWFALSVNRRSDAALRKILKEAGFTVKFTITPAMRDVMAATVAQNVSLIKSIGQQHHTEVEGLVMRSVQAGRDLSTLTDELQRRYAITRRRAALIARDQNNKTTAVLTRVRQTEAGITEAVWLHSHGGREPRPTHLANSGRRYDIGTGWYDPDPKVRRNIWPGELINCFPASTRLDLAHDIKKAYRHRYRGELTEIVTDAGETLSATPNHPVLTTGGWQAIGSLYEGDRLVNLRYHSIEGMEFEGDENEPPPVIGDVFEAVRKAGLSWFEIALGHEFHGDAIANRQIDVVFANRPLSFHRKFGAPQGKFEFDLPEASDLAFGLGFSMKLFSSGLRAAALQIGGHREALSPGGSFALHPDEVGVAAIPDRAADGKNASLDLRPGNATSLGEPEDTFPGLMLVTKPVTIIGIRRVPFEGHVYNLQTESGWYVADGLIVHNCRCVSKPIVKGFS